MNVIIAKQKFSANLIYLSFSKCIIFCALSMTCCKLWRHTLCMTFWSKLWIGKFGKLGS